MFNFLKKDKEKPKLEDLGGEMPPLPPMPNTPSFGDMPPITADTDNQFGDLPPLPNMHKEPQTSQSENYGLPDLAPTAAEMSEPPASVAPESLPEPNQDLPPIPKMPTDSAQNPISQPTEQPEPKNIQEEPEHVPDSIPDLESMPVESRLDAPTPNENSPASRPIPKLFPEKFAEPASSSVKEENDKPITKAFQTDFGKVNWDLSEKDVEMDFSAPLFVRADLYSDVITAIDDSKKNLRESDEVLYRCKETHTELDLEYNKWNTELEDIQRKLISIDQKLFER